MKAKHTVFVRDEEELEKFFRQLKLMPCPLCECRGTLNRHSRLYGNDPQKDRGEVQRGQRVFCCARGQRGGCGGTFPVYFAWILPRHTITTGLLWSAAQKWLAGHSLGNVWERLGRSLALDSFYHLFQRLRLRLSHLRTVLSTLQPPPRSAHIDPRRQTLQHLQAAFPKASCPMEAFQQHFQDPLMG